MKLLLTFIILTISKSLLMAQSTIETYTIETAQRFYNDGSTWSEVNLKNKGQFTVYKNADRYEKIKVKFKYDDYSFDYEYIILEKYSNQSEPNSTVFLVQYFMGYTNVGTSKIALKKTNDPNKLILVELENRPSRFKAYFLGSK